MKPRYSPKSRRGLALREVVVVGIIVFIILMLLAPILVRMRATSREKTCTRNLQLTARAVAEFEELDGNFPGYRDFQLAGDETSRRIGWVFRISPYLRMNPSAERFSPGPWAGIHDRHGIGGEADTRGLEPETSISLLICPGFPLTPETPSTFSSYVVNAGLPDAPAFSGEGLPDWPENGVFLDYSIAGTPKTNVAYVQVRDGADMTLLLSENTAAGSWSQDAEPQVAFLWDNAEPDDPKSRVAFINRGFQDQTTELRNARPSSYHPGGVNVVFVGGGTRFLSDRIDPSVYVALMTPDSQNLRTPGGGQPLGPPYGLASEIDAKSEQPDETQDKAPGTDKDD